MRRWSRAGGPVDRLLAALLAFIAAAPAAAHAESDARTLNSLPRLGAVIDQTSVSGISSGAYMAGQFQIAHSRIVVGAAIIAGGPYGCADSTYSDAMWGPVTAFLNLSKAVNGCMLDGLRMWGIPDPAGLAKRTRELAAQGRIDPVDGIVSDRIYLFSGTKDYTVVPSIVGAAALFYRDLGVPAENMQLIADVPAGHAFIVESDTANACARSTAPYVVGCHYDQAGALLAHVYGPLVPRAATAAGDYVVFGQDEFTKNLADTGLSDLGVAYVPADCRTKPGCRIHIAFHGCSQNRALVGDAFVKETGFARWADTNRLIVLFPQAEASALNPQGCWDWWGYTGRDYLTRKGPQIVAVHRMLERLASPP